MDSQTSGELKRSITKHGSGSINRKILFYDRGNVHIHAVVACGMWRQRQHKFNRVNTIFSIHFDRQYQCYFSSDSYLNDEVGFIDRSAKGKDVVWNEFRSRRAAQK
jgi:hypothetical protein